MRLFPRSLNFQVILLVSCILLATGAISGWVMGRRQAAMLTATMRDHATSMTRSIAEGCAHYLVLREYAGLESQLLGPLGDRTILRLQVLEPDGLVVGDVENGTPAKSVLLKSVGSILTPPESSRTQFHFEDNQLIVWEPIWAGPQLGWLKATFDLSLIQASQAETWRDTLLLSLLWVVFSIGLLLIVLSPLVQTIGRLSVFARRLDEHKGEQISVSPRTREIAELAASLNHASMTLALSERQLLEDRERLRHSYDYIRQLISAASVMIVGLDGEGRVKLLNDAARQISGYEGDEMHGDTWFEKIMPRQHFPQVWEDFDACLQATGNIPGEFEHPLLTKTGEECFISWRNSPIQSGSEISTIAFGIDITQRKQAEETLRDNQRFIRSILDSVDESFIVVDRDFRIISANRAFGDMVHRPDQQVEGEFCYQLLAEADLPCNQDGRACPVRQTFATGAAQASSHCYVHRQEGDVYLDLKSYPILNDANEVVSVIEILVDVSESRKLEDHLHQAQKLESVGQLAGGIAHDFNNMLAVILGCTQMAMRKVASEDPLQNILQEIRKSAERSAELVRQLLAFARKQVITPQVIDLNRTVEGMLQMLRHLIGEEIDLVWFPGDNPLPVNMDPVQLDQILANLCINARHAINGAGQITIKALSVEISPDLPAEHLEGEAGEYVLLNVSDNGSGMTPAVLRRIFEPFYSTKPVGQGTGLGLSTVYGIVKQNGGIVDVHSEPGQGTTFKIYLPRYAEELVLRAGPEQEIPSVRGTETILLVEDESGLLDMTRQMLEECGYRVFATESPELAIQTVSQDPGAINLLISDVIMPEMNGCDLEKRLKQICPGLKCLFMSGYPSEVILRHGVLEEGVHFIQKPFSYEGLTNKIREILGDVLHAPSP